MSTEFRIDFEEITQNSDAFSEIIREWKKARAETTERLSESMKRTVDSQIAASGVNDSRGTVRAWQQSRIGSGKGYAAVSPVKGGSRGNSPGAITNYLESSHKVRSPSGRAKRYKPRIKRMQTRAFRFYYSAGQGLEADIAAEEQKLESRLDDIIKEALS